MTSIDCFGVKAKIQGFQISTDSLTRDSDRDTVELTGTVRIQKDDQMLEADHVVVYLRSKKIELYSRALLLTPTYQIGGDILILDYESGAGMIYNGYVQSGSVMFEGTQIQKISETEYYVTDAKYTTCNNCPASWDFEGKTIRAELGGYAYIKRSSLHFGGVPVFWLPYLIVPLKSDRQSGLLTPEFEQSSEGGFTLGESFFWAISRSQDATIGFKNYEKRGLKGLLNYRYVLSEGVDGEFDTAMIRDRVFRTNSKLNDFRDPNSNGNYLNRWFLKYKHQYELPGGYIQKTLLNNSSDLLYSRDFPLETGNFGDSAMENRISISKNTENSHWHIDSSYYMNLLRSNPLAGNEDAVHRLPEYQYNIPNTQIYGSNLTYSVNFNYINFARSSRGYDDLTPPLSGSNGTTYRYVKNSKSPHSATPSQTEIDEALKCDSDPNCHQTPDGNYVAGEDLIRTGQRLDFKPTLFYSFQPTPGIEILPRLTYRETHYHFDAGEERNNIRRLIRTDLISRATVSRTFGELDDPLSNRINHEIQPEVTYSRIPWIDHRSHPFFGFTPQTEAPISSKSSISDGDLWSPSGLQFDYTDRIYDSHLMTFAITNRWTEKRWNQSIPQYKQIALLRVSQSYDLYQASKNDPTKQPWSDIATVLNISLNNFETYANFNYFPEQKVTNTSARIKMTQDKGQFFQIGLSRSYEIVPGQDVDTRKRTEDYLFASGFESPYFNLMGKFVYDGTWGSSSRAKEQIKSWAYIAQFKPPGECWMITWIHDQITGGESNIRLNFDFNFDGKPKPSLPPETLDKFGF